MVMRSLGILFQSIPQAIRPSKTSAIQSKILEQLKQVKIKLHLPHVIKKIPIYAKVIKNFCTNKGRHNVKNTTFLTKQVITVNGDR